MPQSTVIARETATGPTAAMELDPGLDAAAVFERFAALPHAVYFDSATQQESVGRYSFVAADPFDWLEVPADGSDAFDQLEQRLAAYASDAIAGLPPFQGGAAGLFGYELGRSLEQMPRPAHDEFAVPALAVGLYDVVAAFDHQSRRGWLISQGFPELAPEARHERGQARLCQFQQLLASPPRAERRADSALATIPREVLAPQFAVPQTDELTSSFSAGAYLAAVQRAVEYIHAGDVFQVNLAQRLLHPAETSPVELYLRLRQRNPAPFAGYLDTGDFQICSASPERFLSVRDGLVETRPIKGTRGRSHSPEADLFSGDELRLSEKDRAENVMIVDLLRNDLSRVCRPESVCVTQLCGLETYAYVQHLVSVIEGRLQEGCAPLDALRAAFPGGSITGAPKLRAMEIISELEPTARGAYCGSLGYLGFDGAMDSSILIRTITAGRGWWQFSVGGGIVADSDPQKEYEETWHKAQGLLRALRP